MGGWVRLTARMISNAERRVRLGVRHFLAEPAASVEEAATALVGLHSSDPATVYLAAWARLDRPSVAEIEEALYERRSLVRILGMRRTMFVVPPDVAAIINAACTQRYAGQERRRLIAMLEAQDITKDGRRWLRRAENRVLAELAERGELTATELTAAVPQLVKKLSFGEGKEWAGEVGVSTRVLFLLATEGRIVRARPRGTWISSQYRWTRTDAWLAEAAADLDTQEASAELLRQWLAVFGPATFTDIKWWTGWPVGQAREALQRIGAVEVELEEGTGYAGTGDLEPVAEPASWAALLPSLDPTIMGWKERDWYLGAHAGALFDRNGNAGPTVWWNGRVVGGWAQNGAGEVLWELLEPVPAEAQRLIEAEAAQLTAWLDGTVVTPRFPTRLAKELSTRTS